MIFIGIDPGVGGGIAWITDRSANGAVIQAIKMPETDADVWRALTGNGEPLIKGDYFAILERANASPQMGVVSAFTFGRGFGGLRMALTASRVPFDEVRPQQWQQAMGCLSGGDKNITKRRAQSLFPSLTITHAIADALLIAEYGRRLHLGLIVHAQKKR